MPECCCRIDVRIVRVEANGTAIYSVRPGGTILSSEDHPDHADDDLMSFEDQVSLWNVFLSNRERDE